MPQILIPSTPAGVMRLSFILLLTIDAVSASFTTAFMVGAEHMGYGSVFLP